MVILEAPYPYSMLLRITNRNRIKVLFKIYTAAAAAAAAVSHFSRVWLCATP